MSAVLQRSRVWSQRVSSLPARTTNVSVREYCAPKNRGSTIRARWRRYMFWTRKKTKRPIPYRQCQNCGAPARIGMVCLQCLAPPPRQFVKYWSEGCDEFQSESEPSMKSVSSE